MLGFVMGKRQLGESRLTPMGEVLTCPTSESVSHFQVLCMCQILSTGAQKVVRKTVGDRLLFRTVFARASGGHKKTALGWRQETQSLTEDCTSRGDRI